MTNKIGVVKYDPEAKKLSIHIDTMTNKIYEAHLQVNRHFIFTTEARVHCARASERITLSEMEKFAEWIHKNYDAWDEGWIKRNDMKGGVKTHKDLTQDYLKTL